MASSWAGSRRRGRCGRLSATPRLCSAHSTQPRGYAETLPTQWMVLNGLLIMMCLHTYFKCLIYVLNIQTYISDFCFSNFFYLFSWFKFFISLKKILGIFIYFHLILFYQLFISWLIFYFILFCFIIDILKIFLPYYLVRDLSQWQLFPPLQPLVR